MYEKVKLKSGTRKGEEVWKLKQGAVLSKKEKALTETTDIEKRKITAKDEKKESKIKQNTEEVKKNLEELKALKTKEILTKENFNKITENLKMSKKMKSILEKNNVSVKEILSYFISNELVFGNMISLKLIPYENKGVTLKYRAFGVGDKHVDIERSFSLNPRKEKTAIHDLFYLSEGLASSGIGRKILDKTLDFYDKIGIKNIELSAGLDVGTYLWARVGFETKDKVTERNIIKDFMEFSQSHSEIKSVHDIANYVITKEEYEKEYKRKEFSTKHSDAIFSNFQYLKANHCITKDGIKIGKAYMLNLKHMLDMKIKLNSHNGLKFREYVKGRQEKIEPKEYIPKKQASKRIPKYRTKEGLKLAYNRYVGSKNYKEFKEKHYNPTTKGG